MSAFRKTGVPHIFWYWGLALMAFLNLVGFAGALGCWTVIHVVGFLGPLYILFVGENPWKA